MNTIDDATLPAEIATWIEARRVGYVKRFKLHESQEKGWRIVFPGATTKTEKKLLRKYNFTWRHSAWERLDSEAP